MADAPSVKRLRARAVFVSDVHLGSRDCRAAELLDFLAGLETDYLYLVGDIIDFWSLRRSFHWPQAHNEVLRMVLDMARRGTEVIIVPGNHDEDLRAFCGARFGNLVIRRRSIHSTVDGRDFLVLHGDEFDTAVKCSRWLAGLGAAAYEWVMRINRGVNLCRTRLGLKHWSLATYVKLRLPNAVRYVAAFEAAAAEAARSRQLAGVICGHIHRAALRDMDGVLYCNDGDWVESCSALIESHAGQLSLWQHADYRAASRQPEWVGAAA